MYKIISTLFLSVILVGCSSNAVNGTIFGASEICEHGVDYLVFKSGVSVEYAPNGEIKTCLN
jgi:hypothetical protein